jgi:hypothetical protein
MAKAGVSRIEELDFDDQLVPFGNITEGVTIDLTVTVTNVGGADLVLGTIAGTNPLAEPFSLAIPSNDPDEAPVLVSVSGTGITLGEGGVGTPEPSGASSGFMAIDPATLLLLSAAGAWGWRRRRAQ